MIDLILWAMLIIVIFWFAGMLLNLIIMAVTLVIAGVAAVVSKLFK